MWGSLNLYDTEFLYVGKSPIFCIESLYLASDESISFINRGNDKNPDLFVVFFTIEALCWVHNENISFTFI